MFKAIFNAFANLFRSPLTLRYPAETIPPPPGHRGLIRHNDEACIFCDKCENVCPPGAILFFQHEDGSKTYRYNPWQCIYCGECVRACPKPEEALWQSEEKPECAVSDDRANAGWFEWEQSCQESRENYAAAKKAAKAAKTAASVPQNASEEIQ